MKYKLRFITENGTDFKKLKKDGYGGCIFLQKFATKENLKEAKQNRLKTFLHIGELSKIECEYLDGGIVKQGIIYAAEAVFIENIIKSLEEAMPETDGFMIPFPCIAGLLWDEGFPKEYGKLCGRNLTYDIPLLSDEGIAEADVREWYYKRSADKIFEEFVLPVCNYLKSLGKTACFELGNIKRADFCIRKLMIPSLFDKAKIPTMREEDGEPYYFSPEHNKKSETLLVTSLRGIMRMYAWDMAYSKEESDFSLAVCEADYYISSLRKCGVPAYVIDDFAFSRMRTDSLRRFENILILKSCFVENGRVEKLRKMGIKVNDAAFLEMLDREN